MLYAILVSNYVVLPLFQNVRYLSFVLCQTSLTLAKFIEKYINIHNTKLMHRQDASLSQLTVDARAFKNTVGLALQDCGFFVYVA